MCLWKRERTYLFLPFGTTLVRQPHYAGGRCADKLEEYTAVLGNRASLDSIAGTYNGVLPPNVETTLTLNADGTYLLIRTFKEKQNEQEKLRGTFQVLDGNILMLVHHSSGEHTIYKVKDANFIVLTDSIGNEPEGETAKFYVLKKKNKKYTTCINPWFLHCSPRIYVIHSLFFLLWGSTR